MPAMMPLCSCAPQCQHTIHFVDFLPPPPSSLQITMMKILALPLLLAVPASADFFTVVHKFVDESAKTAFWAAQTPESAAAYATKNLADGVYNHYFLPDADNSDYINCLWETKNSMTDTEFQTFIDGPDGPSQNTFVNTPYRANVGAALPKSAFVAPLKLNNFDNKVPAGSVFWVEHTFVAGKAADWLAALANVVPAEMAAANIANGVNNPQFILLGTNDTDATMDAMCVWETENVMTVAEFQKFIDGPTGPGEGVFKNVVHKWNGAGYGPEPAFEAVAVPTSAPTASASAAFLSGTVVLFALTL